MTVQVNFGLGRCSVIFPAIMRMSTDEFDEGMLSFRAPGVEYSLSMMCAVSNVAKRFILRSVVLMRMGGSGDEHCRSCLVKDGRRGREWNSP